MNHDYKEDSPPTKRKSSRILVEEAEEAPTSHSSESIYDLSDHEDDSDSIRSKQLRPQISHTSSTNAVGGVTPNLERVWTNRTNRTTTTNSDPAFEVDFADNDSGNPQNWSLWYKSLVIGVMSYSTACVVLYSTSFTSGVPGLQEAFGISETLGILGLTTYMLGTLLIRAHAMPRTDYQYRYCHRCYSAGPFVGDVWTETGVLYRSWTVPVSFTHLTLPTIRLV